MPACDWELKTDMAKLRAYRMGRLDSQMAQDSLDALVTMRVDNVRYMTSFRPNSPALFYFFRYGAVKAMGQTPYALVASGDYARALKDMPWLESRVKPMAMDVMLAVSTLTNVFRELGLSPRARIGIDEMGFQLFGQLCRENPDYVFVDGSKALAKAKVIKGPEEVDLLKQACVIAEKGMRVGIDAVREGVTELDISAEIQYAMIKAGSEGGHTHPTQVNSGENAITLTRFPTERRIRNGDFVLMDVGCTFNGYNSDFCRTVLVGKATQEQKRTYQTVYHSLWAAIEACKPGVETSEVDRASRDVIREAGLEKYWYFGVTGHGIGVSLQEPPIIGEKVAAGEVPWVLQPGMVFSIEPSIHLPGVGGIRLEDSVLVTDTGYEVLTRTAYQDELLAN